MKTKLLYLAITAGALVLTSSMRSQTAAMSSAQGGQVQVIFDHPERFTDALTRAGGQTDPQILDTLRDFVVSTASPRLAPGTTLTMTFSDVDMAGAITDARPTRQIRSIFPASAKFTWTLTDANGAVVRQGSENVSATVVTQSSVARERLGYEKQMLQAWIRRTFR